MKHITPYTRFINESVEEMEQIASLILNGGFELDLAMEMIKHLNSDALLQLKKVLLNKSTEGELYQNIGDQASELFNLLGLSDLPMLLNLIGKRTYDLLLIPRPRMEHDGTIDLHKRDLTTLPKSIGNCLGIRNVELGLNELVDLPSEFTKLKNTVSATISGNKFKEFPPQLLELPKLESLGISDNPLLSVPKEIEKLTELRFLYLDETLIESLPDELFNLPKLNTVSASTSQLLELPANVKNSPVRYINVAYCRLKSLPEGIGESNLIELHLSDNQFTEFPSQLFTSKKLQLLDLSNNNISFIPNEISQLSNLETLYLSGNRNLVDLPINALLKLERLVYISVSQTGIFPEQIKEFKKIFAAAQKEVYIHSGFFKIDF